MFRFGDQKVQSSAAPTLDMALASVPMASPTEKKSDLLKAAAVLMFPIATATADAVTANAMPFVVAVALSAASSLASPIGYQTNLMVYGPGGYRSGDYLRFGGLLSVIIWIMIVLLVPWAWPL